MPIERGFPKVRVISLHSADCKQAAKGRRYVRCRCPKALYWFQDGRDHVEVAGTDEYEEAKQYARDKEIALICRALSSWYANWIR